MWRRSLISHDERHIYRGKTSLKNIDHCSITDWVEGYQSLSERKDSFVYENVMELATYFHSIALLKCILKEYRHVYYLRRAFKRAFMSGFIHGMILIKRQNIHAIIHPDNDYTIAWRYPTAIWLLHIWLKRLIADHPTAYRETNKTLLGDINQFLVIAAFKNSTRHMKLAKKMGATDFRAAMRSASPKTQARELARRWVKGEQ